MLVHCTNPLPCGKWRGPARGGTREILEKNKYIIGTDFLGESGLPTIDVVQYPLGPLIQIRGLDIIINPCYYMVLEDTFYQLMEDVQ